MNLTKQEYINSNLCEIKGSAGAGKTKMLVEEVMLLNKKTLFLSAEMRTEDLFKRFPFLKRENFKFYEYRGSIESLQNFIKSVSIINNMHFEVIAIDDFGILQSDEKDSNSFIAVNNFTDYCKKSDVLLIITRQSYRGAYTK